MAEKEGKTKVGVLDLVGTTEDKTGVATGLE